jgi:hypothetical protein
VVVGVVGLLQIKVAVEVVVRVDTENLLVNL